jgi:hypothetical protein
MCSLFWSMLFGCPEKRNLSHPMHSTNFHARDQTRPYMPWVLRVYLGRLGTVRAYSDGNLKQDPID